MVRAEQCLAHSNFMGVELLYERVHYEACGYIRSRAYRLVEVSQRSGFGTNHICKLIAFSAFRLCELRSGALTQSISRQLNDLTVALAAVGMDDTGCQQNDGTSTDNKNQPKKEESETNGTSAGSSSKLGHYDDKTRQAVEACAQAGESTKSTVSNWAAHHAQQGLATVPTTRLDPALAKELALNHGILALRMPCVAPVIEWNSYSRQKLEALYSLNVDLALAVVADYGEQMDLLEMADRARKAINALWGNRV
ncbi:hypothetical protein ABEF95_007438 [Exophiala dermatitidis]